MKARLKRVRRVLAMDANEAMDHVVRPYLGLFFRYPIPMHVLGTAMVVGVLLALWRVAGTRAALIGFALIVLWPLAFFAMHLLSREKYSARD